MKVYRRRPARILLVAATIAVWPGAQPAVGQTTRPGPTPPPSAVFDHFRATLSAAEARDALAGFDSRDRRRSRLTPGHRGGLRLDRMDAPTRAAAFALVDSVLSPQGRATVRAIIRRERALGRLENSPDYRDPNKYYLAVFGTPAGPRWSIRFEGHHLSLNVTLARDRIVGLLPLRLGANPEILPDSRRRLLTPIYTLARQAHEARGGGARATALGGLVPAVLAVFQGRAAVPVARRIEAQLRAGRGATWRDGYRFTGGGATLAIRGLRSNHIHLILTDEARDFGGAK